MENINLTDENIANIELFKGLLNKDNNTILNEALEEYFINSQEKLLEKQIADEKALSTLSYDEFWDDLDV